MTIAFDTLRAATRLREEAGFDESQARVLVDILAEGLSESLATKVDLERTETPLRSDLEKFEKALRGEIAGLRSGLEKFETSLRGEMREMERRMTIRLGGMMVVAVGLAAAAARFL